MKLIPKNWVNFQHYKLRSPPWIKLHRNLLDDMQYQRLPIASKALAPMLWLLASESIDGAITKGIDEIAFRLRMTEKDVAIALKPLIDNGFFIDASDMLSSCYQDATPETETEIKTEKKRDIETPDGFELFWNSYGKKKGKPNAIREWLKLNLDGDMIAIQTIVNKAKDQALAIPDPKFRKDPERWLKGHHWEDEYLPKENIPQNSTNAAFARLSLISGDKDAKQIA